MVNLLRRRVMMEQAGISPLYRFDNLTKTGGYQQYSIRNGNHFVITGTRRGYESDWQFDKGVSGSQSTTDSWTTPMFSIPANASIRIVLSNLNISSNRAGYFNFILRRYEEIDGTKIAAGFVQSQGTGITYTTTATTGGREEISAVSPSNVEAHYFGFFITNSVGQTQNYTIEFDLEVYINNIRYV